MRAVVFGTALLVLVLAAKYRLRHVTVPVRFLILDEFLVSGIPQFELFRPVLVPSLPTFVIQLDRWIQYVVRCRCLGRGRTTDPGGPVNRCLLATLL